MGFGTLEPLFAGFIFDAVVIGDGLYGAAFDIKVDEDIQILVADHPVIYVLWVEVILVAVTVQLLHFRFQSLRILHGSEVLTYSVTQRFDQPADAVFGNIQFCGLFHGDLEYLLNDILCIILAAAAAPRFLDEVLELFPV